MNSSAASPGLLARLKAAMFYELPEEDRAAFSREATFANYPRAGIFAFAVGAMNFFLGVIPDLLVWRPQGKWDENPAFIHWFGIHLLLSVFAAVFVPLLHRWRPATADDVTGRHGALAGRGLGGRFRVPTTR